MLTPQSAIDNWSGETSPDVKFPPGLVVRDGDTLVIATEKMTHEGYAEMRSRIREYLPESVKVIIVPATGLALYRPDAG